jgi:hypothetical protein
VNSLSTAFFQWWRAAEGEWTNGEVSIFRIAEVETRTDVVLPDPDLDPHQMSVIPKSGDGSHRRHGGRRSS